MITIPPLELTLRQQKLLEFVKLAHGEQKRKYTFEPYWQHPLAVAAIANEFEKFPVTVEVALLHDVCEDVPEYKDPNSLIPHLSDMGYHKMDIDFILDGVRALTEEFTKEKYPQLNRIERKRLEAIGLGKIMPAFQSIKYADLIHNTSSIVAHDLSFAKIYLQEKVEILNHIRQGNISLLIKCCHILQESLNILNLTNDTKTT